MIIAQVGCLHGELTKVYKYLESLGQPIDLVICCGDFQSLRHQQDMHTLACPPKYRSMGDFHHYYTG